MLIVGAKGFAKELLENICISNRKDKIVFFDNINKYESAMMFDEFKILQTEEEAKEYFQKYSNLFTLGIGGPKLRNEMCLKFEKIGGILTSIKSHKANIGSYNVKIADGCNIMAGSIISNDVTIGKGCIVYFNSIITHDCVIGDFVEISPGATILGRSKIGNYTVIGSNATILPDVEIGENVIVGAGAVVTKNVSDNMVVKGVPGKSKLRT